VQSLTELKTDVTKRYIDWAVDNDFQVIDVNVPRVVSIENVSILVS
jgi:histone deacetylase 6